MLKLLWRVKLVAERQPGVTLETELVCIERDAQAGLADLGLSLAEAKQLTAALQAEIGNVSAKALRSGVLRQKIACCLHTRDLLPSIRKVLPSQNWSGSVTATLDEPARRTTRAMTSMT